MKCAACSRPVTRFKLSMRVRGGLIGWGPKCAMRLSQAKLKQSKQAEPVEVDPRQMALELA